MTPAEEIARLRQIAEAQQKQLQAAKDYANRQQDFLTQQAEQLRESRRQLEASQQSISELTEAFTNMSTQQRPVSRECKKPKKTRFFKKPGFYQGFFQTRVFSKVDSVLL